MNNSFSNHGIRITALICHMLMAYFYVHVVAKSTGQWVCGA